MLVDEGRVATVTVLVGEGRVSFRDIALRHRRQAARQALSFGTLAGLDQSQKIRTHRP